MYRFLKLVGPPLLALFLGGPAWGQPAVPLVAKRSFPPLTLPDRASSGQRAIDLLDSRLPEVAARPRPPAPARWTAPWHRWSRLSCCTAARAPRARSISISRAPR